MVVHRPVPRVVMPEHKIFLFINLFVIFYFTEMDELYWACGDESRLAIRGRTDKCPQSINTPCANEWP